MRVLGVADDGSAVAVERDGDFDRDALVRCWPPFGLRMVDDPDARLDLMVTPPGDGGPSAWDRLESDLALFTVERLDGLVAIHAATLIVGGRALLLPGRSHAGKTTLSLALATEGATLASDEYALVDGEGRVTGWPRPARIRVGAGGSRREPVAPRMDPVPVGMVALLRYDANHAGPEAVSADVPTRADAVVAVLDETVCARSRPDESLDAALAVTQASVLRGTRGQAEDAARWLLERMTA